MSGPRRVGLMPLALRWLMWSRRRAALVLGVALVVMVGLARLLGASHTPAPSPSAAPSAAPSPAAPACPPAPPPPPKATPISPVKASTEFAGRWVDHGGDPNCWLGALRPWSTDAYGTQVLPTVDPSTVPASRVSGTARLASQQGRAAEVTVPLDSLSIRVSLLDITGRGDWRVNDINPDTGPDTRPDLNADNKPDAPGGNS